METSAQEPMNHDDRFLNFKNAHERTPEYKKLHNCALCLSISACASLPIRQI
jgi:hypothetical protein